MSPRPRVPRNFELLELVFRTTSLALELASLGLLSYLSVEFVYDHATNPVAYAGVRAFPPRQAVLISLTRMQRQP